MKNLFIPILFVSTMFVINANGQNDQFNIKNIAINSDQADFASSFYKDKVVYVSSQEGTKGVKRIWTDNQKPFLDMYITEVSSENELSNRTQFRKKMNKKFHDGPASFTNEGDLMVFTRNNYEGASKEKVVKLKLFYAEMTESDWSEPKSVHFNSNEYSVGQPSLSPDGKTLFFVSDMPGGKGDVDIYKVMRKEDGTWGQPQNIGDQINTSGREMFPFIHKSGTFFFSSDSHNSSGGLDIFVCKMKKNGEFGGIKKLEEPINGEADDFAMVLNEDMSGGFFSSNREGGKGDDDIYSFDMLKPISLSKSIVGNVKDKDGNLIGDAKVFLQDELGNTIESTSTSSDGSYLFTVDPDKKFRLKGSKEDYFDGNNVASSFGENDEITANMIIEKDPGFAIVGNLTDRSGENTMTGAKVTITDNLTGLSETRTIGPDGNLEILLNEKSLNDYINYDIKIEKDGYLTKRVKVNKKLTEKTVINLTGPYDFSLDKIDISDDGLKLIEIDPIYFDLDNSEIRTDASIILDNIVDLMNDNPSLELELGSHTDCRATKSYNMRLSNKRAKASAKYIKDRINNPRRIKGKGYGESKLIKSDCDCENDNVENDPCTDKMHEINRRTEFKIIKF